MCALSKIWRTVNAQTLLLLRCIVTAIKVPHSVRYEDPSSYDRLLPISCPLVGRWSLLILVLNDWFLVGAFQRTLLWLQVLEPLISLCYQFSSDLKPHVVCPSTPLACFYRCVDCNWFTGLSMYACQLPQQELRPGHFSYLISRILHEITCLMSTKVSYRGTWNSHSWS